MKKHLIKLFICFFATSLAFLSLFFNPTIKEKAEKEHKILLMLSSFKRPIFLSGQIARLLNQTYKNHDISVSIKGSDNTYNSNVGQQKVGVNGDGNTISTTDGNDMFNIKGKLVKI